MAVLHGTSLLKPAAKETSAIDVLLVGPEGRSVRSVVARHLGVMRDDDLGSVAKSQGKERSGQSIRMADNILEAVLVSGSTRELDPAICGQLIVAGVSQEMDHLEPGIRSLRKVNPGARIVLLCDSSDEVLCRKSKAWGADDYFLLPLDERSLRQMLAIEKGTRNAAGRVEETIGVVSQQLKRARQGTRSEEGRSNELELPALPLIVQTELLEDLLAARSDFAERAVATLSRHVAFGGHLRFINGPEAERTEPVRGQIRRTVALPDQVPFGTLILETESITPGVTATVAQAANWLAGMLGVSRRQEQLRSMAITDELSGAYNRRYFMKYMASLMDMAREHRSRVTLLLFDIDDFKRYNDTFGHASGDAIIRELIKILRACTREYDLVARIGGDEFAVVYRDNEAPRQPNSEHPKDVLVATERFREAIRNHQWPETCNIKGEVSISGGMAAFPWDADSLEILMAKADAALLRAKAGGKNVIVMHGSASAAPA